MPNLSRTRGGRKACVFTCPRFNTQRRKLERTLVTAITPQNLVRQMLASEKAWSAATDFAREVIEELQKEEKKRREQRMIDAGRQAME